MHKDAVGEPVPAKPAGLDQAAGRRAGPAPRRVRGTRRCSLARPGLRRLPPGPTRLRLEWPNRRAPAVARRVALDRSTGAVRPFTRRGAAAAGGRPALDDDDVGAVGDPGGRRRVASRGHAPRARRPGQGASTPASASLGEPRPLGHAGFRICRVPRGTLAAWPCGHSWTTTRCDARAAQPSLRGLKATRRHRMRLSRGTILPKIHIHHKMGGKLNYSSKLGVNQIKI